MSQSFQLGSLPSINLNTKLKKDWSLNFKIESRQTIGRSSNSAPFATEFGYVLTDYSMITAKRIGLNSRLAFGYLVRFREADVYHRSIQQYTIVQKLSNFRLAHRFVCDQTFSAVERPEFRLRYRLTSELPLNGQAVDAGEGYVKINCELLNSLQNSLYDLEVRLVPLFGYSIRSENKIEIGLDYRANSFLQSQTSHNLWISVNWFVEI